MDILVDLDGTLVDPKPGLIGSVQYALRKLGHPVPSDHRWTLVRAGLAAAWTVPWSPLRMRIVQSIGFLALATLPTVAIDPPREVIAPDIPGVVKASW